MTGCRRLFPLAYWLAVATLFLPPALIVLTSFKADAIVGLPLGRPSLRWYGAIGGDPELGRAVLASVAAAAGSTALALLAGTWTALAIATLRRGAIRSALFAAALVPLVTPGIIHAIALRVSATAIGLPPGFLAVVLGHVIHAAPYVVVLVSARLAAMPPDLTEAARDLGATAAQSVRLIALPWLAPAIGAAATLSLLTSFDDFVRSFFLGGFRPTLPVLLYGRLHGGLTPELNAVASLVFAAAVLVGSWRVQRADHRPG